MNKNGTKKGILPRIEYRWILVAILLLGALVNYLDRSTLSLANTTIAAHFDFDSVKMGLLLSAFMWPYALASLPSGWLVDKFGINKLFLFSIVLWSLSSILGGLVVGFFTMYLARVLLGIAEAPFFIIAGKVVQHYFKSSERGVAASVINLGPRIANGIAPPILVVLMLVTGWRGMFIILGILGIIVGVIWIIFYRKDETIKIKQSSEIARASREKKLTKVKVNIWKLFRHPTMIWVIIGNMGSSYVFWLYLTWLPDYLIKEKHLSLARTGVYEAIPFIAAIFAVMLGGYLSDYFIKKGMKAIKARLVIIIGACLVSGVVAIPINYVNSLWIVMTLITVSLFAYNMIPGVVWALVGDLSPEEAVGTFGGIQNFANFIGATLAPIGTGVILYLTSNNFNWVFITSGIFCIVGAISYSFIRRPIPIEDIVSKPKTTFN
ncbi:MAG: MFS transporter [bacterium]|nr:MFS transporter [bacterium]